MTTKVERQINQLRQRLLDLTMRNRLLNFRPTKLSTIKLVDEVPMEIYDILVLQEKVMRFKPKPKDVQETKIEDESDLGGLTPEEAKTIWAPEDPSEKKRDRHIDSFLQTFLEPLRLMRQLLHISRRAQSVMEEQGHTVLYLALGFLHWTESEDSSIKRRAPLILIPVELNRAKVGHSFKLQWTGEDFSTNISIQSKVLEQGINLPEMPAFEKKIELTEYLSCIEKSISRMKNWSVEKEIFLGFFSFTKFIMYKDLDSNSWPDEAAPSDSSLVQSILDPSGEQPTDSGFSEDEIDEKLNSEEALHVFDADSSQITVIEDVKSGRNLAVEGPPGTGKSQTITNIIAALLGKGKKVLFVSEKMAALDVVKKRLDRVGLGDFCLELHSRKANKKQVLENLERTANLSKRSSPKGREDYKKLDRLKNHLNGYAKAVKEPFGRVSWSPFRMYGICEDSKSHFRQAQKENRRLSFENSAEFSSAQLDEAQEALGNLANILPLVTPVSKHPWNGCSLELILPPEEREIESTIDECRKSISSVKETLNRLVELTGIDLPKSLGKIPTAVKAARYINEAPPATRKTLLSEKWDTPNAADRLIRKVTKLQEILKEVNPYFDNAVFEKNIDSMLQEYKVLSVRFFRIFNARYRSLRREINDLYKTPMPMTHAEIVENLETALRASKLRNTISKADPQGKTLFGQLWVNKSSDVETLRRFKEWILLFRNYLKSGLVSTGAAGLIEDGIVKSDVTQSADAVDEIVQKLTPNLEALLSKVCADSTLIFGVASEDVELETLESQLNIWAKNLAALQKWTQFINLRRQVSESVAKPLVTEIDNGNLTESDLIPCFNLNIAESLLAAVFRERPDLANFIGEPHEKKIEQFAELDRRLIEVNRDRLRLKLQERIPTVYGGSSPGSETGILLGEFNRKRGHRPIRKLLSEVGSLIRAMKPCFMMSPLSVAQFIARTKKPPFDVIVFDEASQVKPEDALGALLRGTQMCVMGDTKQLPPTAFFDHIIEADEEEFEEEESLGVSATELESILHQCRISFPIKMLRWHYRSKHESLIAVSNQEFYDNNLLIYPSALNYSDKLGLKFEHLPDAVYDRGRSSVNRVEAKAVVAAAIDHYRKSPNKSLGIGTFNMKQQQAILDEVELQLRHNPEMEAHFSSAFERRDEARNFVQETQVIDLPVSFGWKGEPFFVKNLETIQGDERDVIFVSIGFGKEEGGRLTLNFGPLNHEGGWRRLNVLITRAKERCVVFSNFTADDLRVNEQSPRGLKALKVFLDYAEKRKLYSSLSKTFDSDSPFEDSVYDFLSSHNFEVEKQIGCANYRIDLGIIDSKAPGRYLVGIECDGANYHSSPVARDRDRLRQEVLRGMGWRLVRIWSTDWYRNRVEAEKKLLSAIEKAKQDLPIAPQSQNLLKKNSNLSPEEPQRFDELVPYPKQRKSLEEEIPPYKVCSNLGINKQSADKAKSLWIRSGTPLSDQEGPELHEQPLKNLVTAIEQVVKVEGPVHLKEVIRRVRTLWGLKRTGNLIRAELRGAISHATNIGTVFRKGDFLWSSLEQENIVRRRTKDPPPDIKLICREEITEAIQLVLKKQFATEEEALANKVGRLLGMQAVRRDASKTILRVIRELTTRDGILRQASNGMLDLADRASDDSGALFSSDSKPENAPEKCPRCGQSLSQHAPKLGEVFYRCSNYPLCNFSYH